ncbi:MAG: hypothetical protein R3A79_25645 [Nannocystaceae bacterium]
MTPAQRELLEDYEVAAIDRDELLRRFGVDLAQAPEFVRGEVEAALASGDADAADLAIELVFLAGGLSGGLGRYVDLLGRLVVSTGHRQHQHCVMALQTLRDPRALPYLRDALAMGFAYLEYTCSESQAIAKWFSHALAAIGGDEAIALLRTYAASEDPGIAAEMRYRLGRLG